MNKALDRRLYESQAEELLNSCELDKALIIYKRLIAMNLKIQKHHYWWGRIRDDQGKYVLSELKFREAVILDPNEYYISNGLRVSFSRQGKYDEAISVFKRILQNPPLNHNLFLNLAITFTKKGDYEEALEWYGKALKTRPFDEKIHNAMGYLYLLQEKYKEAILKFDDAIRNNRWDEMPYFNKAITYFCQSGMEEESQKAFEIGMQALRGENTQKLHALKVSMQDYSNELNRIKQELECEGLGSEARASLEKVHKGLEYLLDLLKIEIEKLAETAILMKILAFYQRKAHESLNTYGFDKAVVLCKRLITMNPKSYSDHYFWARTRGDQEEYRLSELKFREVTILNPQDFLAFNNLGIALSKQGKYEQAISSYKRGLSLSQNNLDLTHNIAIAYTKKGDYEEAVEWYGKALELSLYDGSIHNCMGYLYFLQGHYMEAIVKFDDAIQKNPRYEMPYYNKAIALFCHFGMEEETSEAFRLGIKALSGGYTQKLQRLKASMNNYNSELSRVKKGLERDDLKSDVRQNLEKIREGFEYVLDGLAIEVEKFENLLDDISKKKGGKE